ncbi:DUF397 domain-containing protein [Actinomadura sp. GTD37]|uniref:DUF397 domain-containing protein n=1 Tax=Actinomadura sp. GTD37 TaxID=1778030 RepID=UPI0035BF2233
MSLVWRKSSRSNTQGDECVEVALLEGRVGLRDSKAPEAGHLTMVPEAFAALLAHVKRDEPTP